MTTEDEVHGKHAKHASSSKAKKGKHSSNTSVGQSNQSYNLVDDSIASSASGCDSLSSESSDKHVGRNVAIAIVAVLLVIYLAGAFVFSDRFAPNTTILGQDISFMSDDEVEKVLSSSVAEYAFTAKGLNFDFHITSADVNMKIDAKQIVLSIHEDTPSWQWPYCVVRGLAYGFDESSKLQVKYSEEQLEELLTPVIEAANEQADPPVDATIEFNEEANSFTVKLEDPGSTLNEEILNKDIRSCVSHLVPEFTLTKNDYIQPKILATDKRLAKAAEDANEMAAVNLRLMVGDVEFDTINGSVIAPLIELDNECNVILDPQAVESWANDRVASYNTVGTERTYTRADGKECRVSGGPYGWTIDTTSLAQSITDAIYNHVDADVQVTCTSEGVVYDGAGKPDWGPSYVDIDLSEQHVRYYDENGGLAWESDCVTGVGNSSRATPTGVYYIENKAAPVTLYTYTEGKKEPSKTKVKYWIAFVGHAIGMHDAPWQSSFGGTRYLDGFGSHGCVNLPGSKVAELYPLVHIGQAVVVHW